MMAHQILTATSASVTELKKNTMGTVAAGEGFPVAILSRSGPDFSGLLLCACESL
jgi:antitoxin StbD